MTEMQEKRRATLYMAACAILWSIGGLLIKLIPWHPVIIASMRSLVAAGVFWLYMRKEGYRIVWNKSSVWGGVFLCAVFLFFVTANKLTTAANAIVLQFTNPVFILLFSVAFLGQKFRKGDVVSVLATLAGISLFFFDQLSPGNLLGNGISILAGICLAGMFLITGHANPEDRFSSILFGHLFMAAIGIPFLFLSPPTLTTPSVLSILALGIFQLGIPYVLYGMAAKHCSPLACSLIGALEPLLNPVWVFLFYGEAPGFYALIGGVIVITSVATWIIWSQERRG